MFTTEGVEYGRGPAKESAYIRGKSGRVKRGEWAKDWQRRREQQGKTLILLVFFHQILKKILERRQGLHIQLFLPPQADSIGPGLQSQ